MNEKQNLKTGYIKLIIGWLVVLAIRLFPFRPPNVEPILATLMPFSKRFGPLTGFLFGSFSIIFLDMAVGRVGMWTLVTALAYGLLGVYSHFSLRNKRGVSSYVITGVIGTLVYDAVTGLSVGPLFFGQSFMGALIGQIPFTLMHVAGTVAFSLTVSPFVERWIIGAPRLETGAIFARLNFFASK